MTRADNNGCDRGAHGPRARHRPESVPDAALAPVPQNGVGSQPVIEIAHELAGRASEISEAILGHWKRSGAAPAEHQEQVEAIIRRTAEIGTQAVADYLVTGIPITPEQSEEWAAPGEAAHRLDVTLANVTRLYLLWRDTVIDIVHRLALERGLERDAMQFVEDTIRVGTDFSLVHMAERFEMTRNNLESQLADKQAHLEYQLLHDPLTGLANRALLIDRLGRALQMGSRRSTRPAVLFLDLDRFKSVNDAAGHYAGDQLLVEVAARLRHLIRPNDTMARLGGDEFVILCEDLGDPTTEGLAVAQRVIDRLKRPFRVGERTLFVAASIGVTAGSPGDSPDEILGWADQAMYRAKQMGRGRVELYDPSIDREALRHAEFSNALHNALAGHQMRVVYQPVFHLSEHKETTREALLRWRHPVLGDVPPSELIPLAEETGLIIPIGRWVLGEACRACVEWRASGVSQAGVTVNVSGRQLEQPEFPADVVRALELAELAPEALTLEITESMLMAGRPEARTSLEHLREIGLKVALDDFGTGYSSLSWLARLPLDVLKIDRSFVGSLGLLERESLIVEAMVNLGHTLGLTVVAEGVESEAQLAELLELGCEQAQGYLLARPERWVRPRTRGQPASRSLPEDVAAAH